MLKRCCCSLLLVSSGIAGAVSWDFVGYSGDSSYFADVSTIRRTDSIAMIWSLREGGIDSSNPHEVSASALSLLEYRCGARFFRVREAARFSEPMGTGSLLAEDIEASEWFEFEADTIAHDFWLLACGF